MVYPALRCYASFVLGISVSADLSVNTQVHIHNNIPKIGASANKRQPSYTELLWVFTQQGLQQQDLGQRVVVMPDQAVPLHRLLLTLHAGSRLLPGQILWCSQRTSGSDLNSFLKRIEHHRCASWVPWSM